MPNCFSLTKIGSPQDGPVILQHVDDEIRKAFGAEPDPVNWYRGWYDVIGLALATGKDWVWCRQHLQHWADIIDWLEANYTYDAWAEIGRRS